MKSKQQAILASNSLRLRAEAIRELFETASLGAPEKAVGFVLWRIIHRYQREVDQALADLDLTHLQFTTLALTAWHGRFEEPVTQADLVRHGDIQRMQVSLMLQTLEKKGMIERVKGVSDVRTKQVTVTPQGIQALASALPLVIDVQQRLFGEGGKAGGILLETLLQVEKN